MKVAPVADLKARLSEYLERCAEGPVIVTKNGRPTAVLVAVASEDELERLVLAHTPRFRAILDAAERRIKRGRGIAHDRFWTSFAGRDSAPRAKRPGDRKATRRRTRPRAR